MKILSENSRLKTLPIELDKSQMHLFDSIRFTLETIEYSFEKLQNCLLDIAEGKPRDTPAIFSYAWSIIDNSYRFRKICIKLPHEDKWDLVNKFNYLADFRNFYQHFDERIAPALKDDKKPIFGTLTWMHYESINPNECKRLALLSGNHKNSEFEFSPFDLTKIKEGVNDIKLQAFQKTTSAILDYTNLMNDLKDSAQNLESSIQNFIDEHNYNPVNWSARQDIVISTTFLLK